MSQVYALLSKYIKVSEIMASETPDSNGHDEKERLIRERAYQLWQADGSPEGEAERYWHRARELIEDQAKSS
jgi:hypothetical protein